jgi:hypothetical protein
VINKDVPKSSKIGKVVKEFTNNERYNLRSNVHVNHNVNIVHTVDDLIML